MTIPLVSNYEIAKLHVVYPSAVNLAVLLIFVVLSLLSIERRSPSLLLDRIQTEQLKGVAIILVVIGHLWVHVADVQPFPIFANHIVSLFLIISGFGLTISARHKKLSLQYFFSRRIQKVMVPYWVITLVILALDYWLLSRTYSFGEVVATFSGMNFDRKLRQLDYTRWFVTLLMIYYAAFFLAHRFTKEIVPVIGLFTLGLTLVLLRFFKLFPLGEYHQIIAFPLGCILGSYYENISKFWQAHAVKLSLILGLSTVAGLVLEYAAKIEGDAAARVMMALSRNVNGILLAFFFIMLVERLGYFGCVSKILVFIGSISYELYLIHGPLLIKYNPAFGMFPDCPVVINFLVLFLIMSFLSYALQRAITKTSLLFEGNARVIIK